MFGCGNWSKFYHEFEKFVQFVAIPRFKRVSNEGCEMNKSFCYVHKKTELLDLHECKSKELLCLYIVYASIDQVMLISRSISKV